MKKRLVWLDMAKGAAIVLMVLGHCLDSSTPARAFVYSFHMPLFFILAGFTMHAKPRKQVLATSFRRLLVPYFAVSAVLLLFAFVPPSSISSALDTQRPASDVIAEILFASGQEGSFLGFSYQAIGALWFLPCLFVGRLVLNEILLLGERMRSTLTQRPVLSIGASAKTSLPVICANACEAGCAATALLLGFAIGNVMRLPFDVDTALVAVGFMYIGYVIKKIGIERIPDVLFVLLAIIWLQYPAAGSNEMAIRAYLDNPWSIATAVAGSLVVMRLCMSLAKAPILAKALAWCGIYSLSILCVHRIESAVLNWQKVMEFFRPDVWGWSVTAQGFYQFGLRIAFVITFAVLAHLAAKSIRAALADARAKRSRSGDVKQPCGLRGRTPSW